MTMVGTFLGSAKSRLLPASVPFRFFAVAAVLHVALWVAVLLAAADFTQFRGGVGPSLAAVHLLTLGVLTMTAIGAAVQLLPVATARPLAAVWPIKAAFWLLVPGTIALIWGMHAADVGLMIAGALACTMGILLFAGLFADNLRRAGSMPVVRAYGWAAFVSLILLVALGLALSLDTEIGFLADRTDIALAHMILGAFGFMGMLALGFSHVLIPMFALSRTPEKPMVWAGFAAAAATVALGVAGALLGEATWLAAACGLGVVAALLHLRLMQVTLTTGMRKRLGLSFLLVRISWVSLALTPLLGLAVLRGWAGPGGPTLFGLISLGGWLMTFLLGILQRIVQFLVSMHVTRSTGGPPLLSELGASAPLTVHAACHLVAISGLAAAIVFDSTNLAALAALLGLAGALAFVTFIASILKTLASGRTRPWAHP
ncbi:hypothetical protein [Rhodopseudomonas pseudopalustris]|uniref:Uncharacterized protein n=1 Tax=Rhodopseudomonas pseudopalustris TaxID=1513892 RepID=A0A1H8XBE3_9BRAD|nr:hypothetical protein [Rhodopseudomonas pseudopalustris]SEP37172.1 hypothetical protein SAMN05444123_1193 [Rhodopseudomonas pseudopalustris]